MESTSAGFRLTDVALCVIAPLLLAILEIFHPHVHDFLNLDLRLWMTIHYAQMPFFALAGLAMAGLVRAMIAKPAPAMSSQTAPTVA